MFEQSAANAGYFAILDFKASRVLYEPVHLGPGDLAQEDAVLVERKLVLVKLREYFACAISTGAVLTSFTVTMKELVALRAGEPAGSNEAILAVWPSASKVSAKSGRTNST